MTLPSISDITSIGSLILSAVIAFATIIYAIFTYSLAKSTQNLASETKKMREQQADPKISVYIKSSIVQSIFKNLVIENIGCGPAYNVKFHLSNEFTRYDGKNLSEIRIIKDGIPYLPPREKFEFLLTDVEYRKYADEYLTIDSTYENSQRRLFSEKFIIDFSLWKNMITVNEDGINDIVDKLQEISENLKKIEK